MKETMNRIANTVLEVRSEIDERRRRQTRESHCIELLHQTECKLMALLDDICEGENAELEGATVRYRTLTRLEVTDEQEAVSFLKERFPLCLRKGRPEVNRTAVRRLVESGIFIPGVELHSYRACLLSPREN